MFCTKCGKELEEGTVFCTACGSPISGEAPSVTVAQKEDVWGRKKYIPLICVAVHFLIYLINFDFRIKDYCMTYSGWWINLIVPIVIILFQNVKENLQEKIIYGIRIVIEKVLYVIIIISLVYAVYSQTNLLNYFGEIMYWLYCHIPLIPIFGCFCDIIAGIIWQYQTNAFWLLLSELFCMASYVSAYYLVCNMSGDNILFSLENCLKRHKKMLKLIMIVLGAIIVYMIAYHIKYS